MEEHYNKSIWGETRDVELTTMSRVFGETTGQDVEAKNLEIRGNWVFHFDPEYPNEIDCYSLEGGVPMCWEPWSSVTFDKSPFKPNNDLIVNETLQELDKIYQRYS
tara:strand:+ start:1246 stop:1563 length:318 start_codon:yes stop_codon:yes gene_type:complete